MRGVGRNANWTDEQVVRSRFGPFERGGKFRLR